MQDCHREKEKIRIRYHPERDEGSAFILSCLNMLMSKTKQILRFAQDDNHIQMLILVKSNV